ncbi:MAG: hypothetical protein WCA14_03470, partial [Steroidobacteraceae bacterium]
MTASFKALIVFDQFGLPGVVCGGSSGTVRSASALSAAAFKPRAIAAKFDEETSVDEELSAGAESLLA